MAKAKPNIGREILDGLRELKSGLSQARFAVLLGVSVRTLLMVTDRNPHALREDA
jgi:DNA-binding transcriptional regulator YiaG